MSGAAQWVLSQCSGGFGDLLTQKLRTFSWTMLLLVMVGSREDGNWGDGPSTTEGGPGEPGQRDPVQGAPERKGPLTEDLLGASESLMATRWPSLLMQVVKQTPSDETLSLRSHKCPHEAQRAAGGASASVLFDLIL